MKLHFKYHVIFGSRIKRADKDCIIVKIGLIILLLIKGISERNVFFYLFFSILLITVVMGILSLTSNEEIAIENHSAYASPCFLILNKVQSIVLYK
jgi:hypothetical protein